MDRPVIPHGVPERKLTQWHNPLPHLQTVVIHDGAPFAFVVPPGETRELDSRYDRAIQMIDCGREECHRRGWFCVKGHPGQIVGGGAPQLRRVGKSDTLDTSLDPTAAARKDLEAQIQAEVEREKILTEARARRASEVQEAQKVVAATRTEAAPAPAQKK